MKKAEIIIGMLSIICIGLNLQLIPGGEILTFLTLSILSILYLFLSFTLFNNIRLRNIFKKESYTAISTFRIAGSVFTGLILSIAIFGILCKIQFWPGALFILAVALTGLVIVTIIGVIKYSQKKSDFYVGIFKRVAIYGVVALILLAIPTNRLAEFKYRSHPEYLEALKKAMADPEDEELWQNVEKEHQKRYNKKKY